jgi:type IV pilus assembly protein PilZ
MPQESDDRHHQSGELRGAIELRVEYQRLNTFFYDYTRNISRGGTFIRTTRPLPVGTLFLFRLVVPTLEEPLALLGMVRWIRRSGQAAHGKRQELEPGMGIRFVFEDDRQRLTVDGLVERLMVASLGPMISSQLRALVL